jgi:hypothetical protein
MDDPPVIAHDSYQLRKYLDKMTGYVTDEPEIVTAVVFPTRDLAVMLAEMIDPSVSVYYPDGDLLYSARTHHSRTEDDLPDGVLDLRLTRRDL